MTPASEPKQCKNNCNPGAGIPEEGSWRRNPGGGIPEESSWGNSWKRNSWRRNPGGGWRRVLGGSILEEPWRRNSWNLNSRRRRRRSPGRRILEEESWRRNPNPGEVLPQDPGPWHLEGSWSTGEGGILEVDSLPKKHPGGTQETTSGLPGGS